MNPNLDYVEKYRQISLKLKKKAIFKKPNVSEAIHEFESFAKHLDCEEQCPQYAAMFAVAQARCEASLGNGPGEAAALLHAGQLYLKAEEDLQSTRSISLHENLDSAITLFNHAAKIYHDADASSLAGNTCLQIGDALFKFNKTSEASVFYQRAAGYLHINPLVQLTALQKLGSCRLRLRDFHLALSTYTQMQEIAHKHSAAVLTSNATQHQQHMMCGTVCEIYRKCEVMRLFLLLLLVGGGSPGRLPNNQAATLERYSWVEREDSLPPAGMSEELFLLLQSTVLAVQSSDWSALEALQCDLVSHLDDEQCSLLEELLWELRAPRAEAV